MVKFGAEFFQHEKKVYLLMVDYYSRDVKILSVPKRVNIMETILKTRRLQAFTRATKITLA